MHAAPGRLLWASRGRARRSGCCRRCRRSRSSAGSSGRGSAPIRRTWTSPTSPTSSADWAFGRRARRRRAACRARDQFGAAQRAAPRRPDLAPLEAPRRRAPAQLGVVGGAHRLGAGPSFARGRGGARRRPAVALRAALGARGDLPLPAGGRSVMRDHGGDLGAAMAGSAATGRNGSTFRPASTACPIRRRRRPTGPLRELPAARRPRPARRRRAGPMGRPSRSTACRSRVRRRRSGCCRAWRRRAARGCSRRPTTSMPPPSPRRAGR